MKLSAVVDMVRSILETGEQGEELAPGPFNHPFQPQLGRDPAKETPKVSASG